MFEPQEKEFMRDNIERVDLRGQNNVVIVFKEKLQPKDRGRPYLFMKSIIATVSRNKNCKISYTESGKEFRISDKNFQSIARNIKIQIEAHTKRSEAEFGRRAKRFICLKMH